MRNSKVVKQSRKKILKVVKNGRKNKEEINKAIKSYIEIKKEFKEKRIQKMAKKG